MSLVKVAGNASGTGTLTIQAPNTNSNYTLTLPTNTGTILTSATTTGFPAGSVLQVASTLKQDVFTTNSTTYTDVTGLSVSITPTSSSSKILVTAVISLSNTNTSGYNTRGAILRDTTIIGGGTPASNRPAGSFFAQTSTSMRNDAPLSMTVLDSPATTSSTTYKVQIATESGGVASVGRTNDDNDVSSIPRLACSITVMEIAA